MKRVVVTGAAGFIGANVARRLLDDGYEPTLLTGPDSDCWRLAEIERRRADRAARPGRRGRSRARRRQPHGPTGSSTSPRTARYSWQTDRAAILRTNVVGTANLLEAARRAGVEAFVNTGSSSEYGLKDHAPTEDEPVEPNSAYAVAKAVGDDALPSRRRERTDSTSARCVCTRRTAPGRSRSAWFPRSPSRGSTAGSRPSSTRRRRATSSGSATSSTPTSLPPRAGTPSPARSTTSAPACRRRSARRPRSPATSSGSRRVPVGDRCRLARGTPTAGSPTARRSAIGSAGGRRAASGKGSRSLHRGSASGRTSSPTTGAPVVDSLANRTNFALSRTEGWRPPLHSPPDTRRPSLVGGAATADRPPGGKYLAGPRRRTRRRRWPRPRCRLRRPAVPTAPRDLSSLPGHRHDDAKSDFGYEIPDTVYFEGDSWPVGAESVNVVLCTETLEHVLEPSRLLAEAHRTLRPGGKLLLTVPFAARWHFVPQRLLALHAVEPAAPARDGRVHRRGVSMRAATRSRWPATRPWRSCFPISSRSTAASRARAAAAARSSRSPVRRLPRACRSRCLCSARGGEDCLGYTVTAVRT